MHEIYTKISLNLFLISLFYKTILLYIIYYIIIQITSVDYNIRLIFMIKLLDIQHIWLYANVDIFVKRVFPVIFHIIFLCKMKVLCIFNLTNLSLNNISKGNWLISLLVYSFSLNRIILFKK
jgi:hypothetical protein